MHHCLLDKVRQIMGVPVSKPLKLTKYSEAEEMIRQLVSEGMSNVSVKYTGWCNGGVNQKILSKAKKRYRCVSVSSGSVSRNL